MAFPFLEVILGVALLALLPLIYYWRRSKRPAPSPDYSYIQWVSYASQKAREPPLKASPAGTAPTSQGEPITSNSSCPPADASEPEPEKPAPSQSAPLPAILDFD